MTVKLLRKLKGQERVESESVKSRKQSNVLSTHFCWPSYTATHPLIQKELSLSVEIEYTRYTRHIKINIFRITVLSSCDSSHAKIGLLFLRKTSCDRVVLPNLRCMLDFFSCFRNPPNSDMDYRIFNMRTSVDACDCTRGCTVTVRVCTKCWPREKNPLPHWEIEPASAACRSDALPTELQPHI